MARVLLAAALLSSAALAQTPPPAEPPTTASPKAPAAAPAGGEVEEVRREVEAKVENVKRELREEIRAQLATQSVGEGWAEDWTEERRKLELFTVDGYLRVRPDLFNKFDQGLAGSGFTLFPPSPVAGERTVAGVNMRFRFEPTLNVSEEVRVRMQIDALDNLVWGSTPAYGLTRAGYYDWAVLTNGQVPPRSAINALYDSISVKRVYGEVSTPVGILRFGRMGSHWGLGLMNNDGNCLDCDYGDTVDRVMFVTEPFSGWYITPMLDFNVEGLVTDRPNEQGQPFDLSNSDDSHSFIIAVARRDTPQQEKAKLENNSHVFNYGVRFEYRVQRNDGAGTFLPGPGQPPPSSQPRNASLYMPDLWAKYERKNLRVEAEFGFIYGTIKNTGLTEPVEIEFLQYGGAIQSELKLMDGALKLGLEFGLASGDKAAGFGARPIWDANGNPIAQPQYVDDGISVGRVNNFRFNRDYRIDKILFRELIGTITDAMYLKPTLSYELAAGFNLYGAAIGSRAMSASSTPSQTSSLLGIELNAGAQYETEDGFIAHFTYAVLFPLPGFAAPLVSPTGTSTTVSPDTAQALRAMVGIKF